MRLRIVPDRLRGLLLWRCALSEMDLVDSLMLEAVVCNFQKGVSFATARALNEISGSDVADASCKLIETV